MSWDAIGIQLDYTMLPVKCCDVCGEKEHGSCTCPHSNKPERTALDIADFTYIDENGKEHAITTSGCIW